MKYSTVYFFLLILLGLAYATSLIDLGAGNLIASMGIAIVKALLILYFFMHLKVSPKFIHIVAYTGVIWLGVLFCFAMTDYATRGVHPLPGNWPQKLPAEAGAPTRVISR